MRRKGRMTLGLKALFSIAPLLLFLTPSIAAEITYKATRKRGRRSGSVGSCLRYLSI